MVKGTKHGYHMKTIGLLVNELVKRADPKGRPLWVIFQEDIAQEFGTLLHFTFRRVQKVRSLIKYHNIVDILFDFRCRL